MGMRFCDGEEKKGGDVLSLFMLALEGIFLNRSKLFGVFMTNMGGFFFHPREGNMERCSRFS